MDSSADIDGIDVPKSVERTHRKRRSPNERYDDRCGVLFFTLNREDFSFVIHLDRQPRTSRRREAHTGSRARSGSRSEGTLDAVEHSRTLMEWWPFLIFHRGGLRIKVINNMGLAKNVFEIAISRKAGKVSKQLRVSRPKLVSFFAKQSAATVLLEACGSAHFWARTLRRLGHVVVLLPPHLVRPYRRGSKNDRADTKALLEAYRNEEILSVPIKSVRQHTLAALHRLRSGWLSTRTARINAVRGILRELGLFIPKGAHFVVPAISELVEDADSDLPDVLRVDAVDAPDQCRYGRNRQLGDPGRGALGAPFAGVGSCTCPSARLAHRRFSARLAQGPGWWR